MRLVDGALLRAMRVYKNKSAMEVSYAADLNVTYLYRLEVGEHKAQERTVERLAKALNTTPEFFSREIEDEKCDAVKFAEDHGFSRIRAYQYLNEGRVSGAHKVGKSWHIPEGAEILPKAEVASV